MKIQFVTDEGKIIEIVPGMRIVLCGHKCPDAPYALGLIAPDGSVLAAVEYLESKAEGACAPYDLGLIRQAFDHMAKGILALTGAGWRADYWNWRQDVSERLGVSVLSGYMVLE